MRKSFFFILILFAAGCCDTPVDVNRDGGFAIYRLKDNSKPIQDVISADINRLELEDEPWLDEDDFYFYDFSSHTIYLKNNKADLFQDETTMVQFFIVCAGKKRCYKLCTWPPYLSSLPQMPNISDVNMDFLPSDILQINEDRLGATDERVNPYIESTLKLGRKLHYGISISIDSISASNNPNKNFIKYTFRIKNNDRDNLYVLDPLKTGSGLFFYFNNPPSLSNNSDHVFPIYKVAETPAVDFDSTWFTIIESGKSIKRTIVADAYSNIPKGTYNSQLSFSNPFKIDKEERYLQDGRCWIGSVEALPIIVHVQ